jgi:hypothetical protein
VASAAATKEVEAKGVAASEVVTTVVGDADQT